MASATSILMRGLNGLYVLRNAVFQRLAGDRLRYDGEHGTPDAIDRIDAALVCSSLLAPEPTATLVVFPDDLDRRAPLLFATAIVMDAVAAIEAGGARRKILYFSTWAGVRGQLGSVRVKQLALDGVFAQQYGRGRAEALSTTSQPDGVSLPSVICIYAPADPAALLRMHQPKWVAIDCGESSGIEWLRPLLVEAKRLRTPVIGWSGQPFSDALVDWVAGGGGILRWPRLRQGTTTQIDDIAGLEALQIRAVVTPRVLAGEKASTLSHAFASTGEALVAAGRRASGRLAQDAVSIGWRLLRTLETMPVPMDVYEREARSYWGSRAIGELRTAFQRFVEAVEPTDKSLYSTLLPAVSGIDTATELLKGAEPPLWQGLANLCVEMGIPRRVVFTSRARREMFSFCMLARFNVSEDDLRDVGIELGYLSESHRADLDVLRGTGRPKEAGGAAKPLLVGIPSRRAERYLQTLLGTGTLDVLIWPHQKYLLDRRLADIGSTMSLDWKNLVALRGLAEETNTQSDASRKAEGHPLTMGPSVDIASGSRQYDAKVGRGDDGFWKSPNTVDAIASLFGANDDASDDENASDLRIAPANGDGLTDESSNTWVAEAMEILLEGGRRVLLPKDEMVNVVSRAGGAVTIEERFVRALRVGDEVFFIQGQRRQSMYDLLVSRVHRDPTIAQYLALVRRWQDDLVVAFAQSEKQGRMSTELMLRELQHRGSDLTSPQTIRTWLRRQVQAPSDAEDLRRVSEVLVLPFVNQYYRQIHRAARRLHGLHISLSARLNRWLESSDGSGLADDGVIDSELDLRIEDFRDSFLRLRVLAVNVRVGPFYRSHLGNLETNA